MFTDLPLAQIVMFGVKIKNGVFCLSYSYVKKYGPIMLKAIMKLRLSECLRMGCSREYVAQTGGLINPWGAALRSMHKIQQQKKQ